MALEREIKALKATYPVAGSNMSFAVTQSQTFSLTNQGETVRIQFTPNRPTNGPAFTTLRASIKIADAEAGYSPQVNEPQDGTGAVVIRIQFDQYSSATTYRVTVIATGPSAGTFRVL